MNLQGFAPSFAATKPKAIVLVARSADKLDEVAETINKSHPDVEVLVVPTDIADPASVAALFEKVKQKYGHADVLVNNAGVYKATSSVKNVDQQDWWAELVGYLHVWSRLLCTDFKQTMNIHGTFLITQQFLKALPSSNTPAKIVTLTSGTAYFVIPEASAYGLSKLGVLQLMAYVAAENPNVVAVALHPGIVATGMVQPAFEKFALDTPELVGGVGAWLAGWKGPDRSFLNGRFVSANWDVENLVERKDEIVEKDLLKMALNAKMGSEQFSQ
jgi:NAD(P)-dependent dehydrogenase (short-subunit alcohol dehydrogenase family)